MATRGLRVPLWSLLVVVAGSVVVVQSARPLDDPDVWWHVRVGDDILKNGRLPSQEEWTWTATGRRWVPTSWLSDVLMSLAHHAAGWQGVRFLTVFVAALFAISLARHLRSTAGPVAVAVAYALVAVATAGYLRERPQAASLCLVVLLSAWCERVRHGQLPHWLLVGAVSWAWAMLHGMWVLAPVFLAIAGASGGARTLRRCLPAVGAAAVAAALTPVGPRLVVQPFVVASRAREIAEWAPVHVVSWQFLLLAVLAVLCAGAPREERVFGVAVLVFACLAVRDVAPAAILLGPILARRLEALLPTSSSELHVRFAVFLAGIGAATAALLLVLTPSVAPSVPLVLVAVLDEDAGAHVLVDYNIGGLVSGQARNVSAAVDGRTDVYEPGWLRDYLQMTTLQGDWRTTLRALSPDRAVVHRHGGLAHELVLAGWQVDLTQGDWSLLSPPARTSSR